MTSNLRDFPAAVLAKYSIEAQHPDEFITNLMSLDAAGVYAAVKRQRANLRNPPKTAEELIAILERLSLAQTAARLRQVIELV